MSLMRKIKTLHPGVILQEDLLEPLGITSKLLAESIRVPVSTVSNVVNGKEPITPDLAIRLSKFFGFSRNFGNNLQQDYNMRKQGSLCS